MHTAPLMPHKFRTKEERWDVIIVVFVGKDDGGGGTQLRSNILYPSVLVTVLPDGQNFRQGMDKVRRSTMGR